MSEKKVDPELTERKEQRIVTEQVGAAVAMSVADRLTRRAKAQTVDLTLSDGVGDFIITMRQPTRREMDDLQKLQNDIQDVNTQDEANKSLCGMLDSLCIDDSLNYDFWMSGNYSMNDLITLVQKLFESLVKQVKSAQSFRKDGDGPGTIPTMHKTREVSP